MVGKWTFIMLQKRWSVASSHMVRLVKELFIWCITTDHLHLKADHHWDGRSPNWILPELVVPTCFNPLRNVSHLGSSQVGWKICLYKQKNNVSNHQAVKLPYIMSLSKINRSTGILYPENGITWKVGWTSPNKLWRTWGFPRWNKS